MCAIFFRRKINNGCYGYALMKNHKHVPPFSSAILFLRISQTLSELLINFVVFYPLRIKFWDWFWTRLAHFHKTFLEMNQFLSFEMFSPKKEMKQRCQRCYFGPKFDMIFFSKNEPTNEEQHCIWVFRPCETKWAKMINRVIFTRISFLSSNCIELLMCTLSCFC